MMKTETTERDIFTMDGAPKEVDLSNLSSDLYDPNKNPKDEISQFVSEYSASSERVQELLEIVKRLIGKVDSNIEWLQRSNTFKRFWRRVTGKTFRINLQNDQYLNDLNKVAVQLFMELNKQMLLQQKQILWMQQEINFLIKEQNDFRQKLKSHLEKVIEAVLNRFEKVEEILRKTTSHTTGNRQEIRKLKKHLQNQGWRLDQVEKEISKIRHNNRVEYWRTKHNNMGNGDPEKHKGFHGFFTIIDEFLSVTENEPTLNDYTYLHDVLGFYGFSNTNSLDIQTLLKNLVNEFKNNKKETFNRWSERIGLTTEWVRRDWKTQSISIHFPFRSSVEQILLFCEDIDFTEEVSYEKVINEIKKVEKKHSIFDDLLDIQHRSSFDEISFKWINIAKELISYRKEQLNEILQEQNVIANNAYFNEVISHPYNLVANLNNCLEELQYYEPNAIKGWKKKFQQSDFTILQKRSDRLVLELEAHNFDTFLLVQITKETTTDPRFNLDIKLRVKQEQLDSFDISNNSFSNAFGFAKILEEDIELEEESYKEFIASWKDIAFIFETNFNDSLWKILKGFLTYESNFAEIMERVEEKTSRDGIDGDVEKIHYCEDMEGVCIWIESNNFRLDNIKYWFHPKTGLHATFGGIGDAYEELRRTDVNLGYPISGEIEPQKFQRQNGSNIHPHDRVQYYENGSIEWDQRRREVTVKDQDNNVIKIINN